MKTPNLLVTVLEIIINIQYLNQLFPSNFIPNFSYFQNDMFSGRIWRMVLQHELRNLHQKTAWILWHLIHCKVSSRVGPDIRSNQISGWILDIEIIRQDIWSGRLFKLTLLKLSGQLSDNQIFHTKKSFIGLIINLSVLHSH